MPQFQRRGGVVQLQGTPLYLPGFLFEFVINKLDIEFAHDFLKSILPGGTDPLFADDKLLSKTHLYQGYKLEMSRFTPPCSAYITSVGTWSLEQGLFMKASKEEDAVAANKTARKTSLPDKTTTIKVKKTSKSKNLAKKYDLDLDSSDDDKVARKKYKQ
ncbi:unnamed protein product [Oikopleura dioica]|uniref:Uncharacterized protein n=1 Tax=Oikopleura dioica TaxID=34765 RepID=E4XFV3_OIKDI|nr:unnamed protein product [Oikopleura dioica]